MIMIINDMKRKMCSFTTGSPRASRGARSSWREGIGSKFNRSNPKRDENQTSPYIVQTLVLKEERKWSLQIKEFLKPIVWTNTESSTVKIKHLLTFGSKGTFPTNKIGKTSFFLNKWINCMPVVIDLHLFIYKEDFQFTEHELKKVT